MLPGESRRSCIFGTDCVRVATLSSEISVSCAFVSFAGQSSRVTDEAVKGIKTRYGLTAPRRVSPFFFI